MSQDEGAWTMRRRPQEYAKAFVAIGCCTAGLRVAGRGSRRAASARRGGAHERALPRTGAFAQQSLGSRMCAHTRGIDVGARAGPVEPGRTELPTSLSSDDDGENGRSHWCGHLLAERADGAPRAATLGGDGCWLGQAARRDALGCQRVPEARIPHDLDVQPRWPERVRHQRLTAVERVSRRNRRIGRARPPPGPTGLCGGRACGNRCVARRAWLDPRSNRAQARTTARSW